MLFIYLSYFVITYFYCVLNYKPFKSSDLCYSKLMWVKVMNDSLCTPEISRQMNWCI